LGGGASVPIGSYKDALRAGWNGQGSLIFNFAGLPLAVRADLTYNTFTFKNDLPFTPRGTGGGTITTTDDITQQILGGLANITFPFHMGPISPYVTAGLAGFNIKTKLSDAVSGAEDRAHEVRGERRCRCFAEALRRVGVPRDEDQQRLYRQEVHQQQGAQRVAVRA
jgi:opacity protein-like surface antigen